MATSGGSIKLAAGLQVYTSSIDIIQDGAMTEGAGIATMVKRGFTAGTGSGVVNISSNGATLRDMAFDGDVLTATGIDFSTVSDPCDSRFLLNTMIWVHGGTKNLVIENITIQHGSGFGIFLDARAGDIENVIIRNSTFVNNRPFLFGPSGDQSYGSWVGPIFYRNQGNGSNTYSVKNVSIENCTFERNTGNCVWSHSLGFLTVNSNITVTGCTFRNNALDSIEIGNTFNAVVSNNVFHRCGYVAVDDTSDPLPKYQSNRGALAIDCTSNVYGSTFSNNTMISLTGGGFDLDGCYDSVISGNTVIQPMSGDALYTADHISTCGISGGSNAAYGIQTGNTYAKYGGRNLVITGNTIRNMGTRALSLGNAKDCIVTGNNIWHSGGSTNQPIIVFCVDNSGNNGGSAADNRAHGNVIKNNHVEYGSDTPAASFAIAEVDPVSHPFTSTDANHVFGNHVTGSNYGEWYKDGNSGSFAGFDLPTNDNTSTSSDVTRIQREGKTTTATTKIYKSIAGTKTQLLQLSDSSFLNVSVGGGSGTGAIATGNRSTLAWADAIGTSKVAADGFLSLTDTTFNSTEANLLDATYMLLRRSGTNLQVSTTVSAGVRNWTNLGAGVSSLNGLTGSLSIAGTTSQLTVTPSGSTISLSLPNNVIVTGTTNQAGLALSNGFFQSPQGMYTTSTAYDSIKSPSGGGYFGLGVTVDQAFYPKSFATSASLNTPGSGYSGFAHKSSTSFWYYDPTAVLWKTVDFSTVGAGVTSLTAGVGISTSGSTGAITVSLNAASSPTLTALTLTSSATNALAVTGSVAAAGIAVSGTASNSIQSVSGGLTGKYLVTTESIFATAVSTPAVSGASQGKLHFNSTALKWQYSENGAAWANCFGTSSAAGSNTQIQFNNSGSLGASANLAWDGSLKLGSSNTILDTSGNISAIGVYSATGASGGFNVTTNTAYNSIQTVGGVKAAQLLATSYLEMQGQGKIYGTLNFNDANIGGGSGGAINYNVASSFLAISAIHQGVAWLPVVIDGGSSLGINIVPTQKLDVNGSALIRGSLTVSGSAGSAALTLSAGYVSSSEGYFSSSANYDSFKAASGGMYASKFTADNGLFLKTLGTGTAPATPSTGYGALGHRSGSTYWYWNGSSYASVDLSTTGGGITSATAGTGISISGSGSITITNVGITSLFAGTGVSVSSSTGSSTISIGQSVSTSANVTFASVSTSGSVAASGNVTGSNISASNAVQAGASGSSITFQNTNSAWSVNGSGSMSMSGNLNASGYGTFGGILTAAGANFGSSGVGAGGYNIAGGYLGQTVSFPDQNGVTRIFRGGVLVQA
jgi:hypothetical protein